MEAAALLCCSCVVGCGAVVGTTVCGEERRCDASVVDEWLALLPLIFY